MTRRESWQAAPVGLAATLVSCTSGHDWAVAPPSTWLDLGDFTLAAVLAAFERAFEGTVLDPAPRGGDEVRAGTTGREPARAEGGAGSTDLGGLGAESDARLSDLLAALSEPPSSTTGRPATAARFEDASESPTPLPPAADTASVGQLLEDYAAKEAPEDVPKPQVPSDGNAGFQESSKLRPPRRAPRPSLVLVGPPASSKVQAGLSSAPSPTTATKERGTVSAPRARPGGGQSASPGRRRAARRDRNAESQIAQPADRSAKRLAPKPSTGEGALAPALFRVEERIAEWSREAGDRGVVTRSRVGADGPAARPVRQLWGSDRAGSASPSTSPSETPIASGLRNPSPEMSEHGHDALSQLTSRESPERGDRLESPQNPHAIPVSNPSPPPTRRRIGTGGHHAPAFGRMGATLSAVLDALPNHRIGTRLRASPVRHLEVGRAPGPAPRPRDSLDEPSRRFEPRGDVGAGGLGFGSLAAASGTAAANSSGTGDKAEARAGAHLAVSWFDDEDLEERVTAILRAQVKRHGLDPL